MLDHEFSRANEVVKKALLQQFGLDHVLAAGES
jgi:hypothetical protein